MFIIQSFLVVGPLKKSHFGQCADLEATIIHADIDTETSNLAGYPIVIVFANH